MLYGDQEAVLDHATLFCPAEHHWEAETGIVATFLGTGTILAMGRDKISCGY